MTDWLHWLFARLTRDRPVTRIRRDPFLDDPAAVEMSKPQCCHTCGLSAFSLAPSSALLMLAS